MRIKRNITMTVKVAERKCDLNNPSPADIKALCDFFLLLYEMDRENRDRKNFVIRLIKTIEFRIAFYSL